MKRAAARQTLPPALGQDQVQWALQIAELLTPPVDAPKPRTRPKRPVKSLIKPVPLTRDDRLFLQQMIYRAVDLALERPAHRARNAERDFWIAIDFKTRTGRNIEKAVAKDWNIGEGRLVAKIASRKKDDVERALKERPAGFWRTALGVMQRRFVTE